MTANTSPNFTSAQRLEMALSQCAYPPVFEEREQVQVYATRDGYRQLVGVVTKIDGWIWQADDVRGNAMSGNYCIGEFNTREEAVEAVKIVAARSFAESDHYAGDAPE